MGSFEMSMTVEFKWRRLGLVCFVLLAPVSQRLALRAMHSLIRYRMVGSFVRGDWQRLPSALLRT